MNTPTHRTMASVARQYDERREKILAAILSEQVSASMSGIEYYPRPWGELDLNDPGDLMIISTALTWDCTNSRHDMDDLRKFTTTEIDLRSQRSKLFYEPCSEQRTQKIADINLQIKKREADMTHTPTQAEALAAVDRISKGARLTEANKDSAIGRYMIENDAAIIKAYLTAYPDQFLFNTSDYIIVGKDGVPRKAAHPDAVAEPVAHEWHERFGLICCKVCGFVRNENSDVKGCRGPVYVSLRESSPPAPVPECEPTGANDAPAGQAEKERQHEANRLWDYYKTLSEKQSKRLFQIDQSGNGNHLKRSSAPAPAGLALSEGQYDGVRELIRQAYEQGCKDVHENHEEDADPDFTETAYDYTASVTDGLLKLFPSVASPPAPAPDGWKLVPIEPTQEMLDEVTSSEGYEPWTDKIMRETYINMLSASPSLTGGS